MFFFDRERDWVATDLDSQRLAKAVLDRVLSAPPERQDEVLATACEGDTTLRREVEWMLAQEESVEGFLEPPAREHATGPSLPAAGEVVAGHRLLRRIGEGGTSVVFLAKPASGADGELVAVKVLKPSAGSVVRERFHVEQQVLEQLDHPYIARALARGWTDSGLPCLALEYVAGTPITRFCDEGRSTVAQRLALFLEVCEAVAYAHRRLVLHRDLKPSNILVTADGSPKLLDFGTAKPLRPRGDGHEASVTWWQLTPSYASPEHLRGAPLTTASDVFSLGVVLYRLLSGRLPFEHDDGPSDDGSGEAPFVARPMSSAVAAGAENAEGGPAAVAALRRTTPAELVRSLSGDLDAIVGKALEEDVEERYPTVEAFAEDLRRYLAEEPVLASSAGLRYRLVKLWRRHPLTLALSSAATVAILAFGVVSGLLARELAAERDAATRERDRTRRVTQVLVESLRSASPTGPGGKTASVSEVLDRLARRVRQDLRSDREIGADLLETVGRTNGGLGRYDEAVAQLEEALELRRARHGAGHPEVADVLTALGEVQAERGDVAAAQARLEEAQVLLRPLSGESLRRAELDIVLARYHELAGDFEAGAEAARRALREARAAGSEERAADALDLLGSLVDRQGRPDEGERWLEKALEIRRRLHGDHHPTVALSLNNLADLRDRRGQLALAARDHRRALAIRREALGNRHPHVAHSLSNLGSVLHRQGALPEAEEALREALDIARELAPRQIQEAVARNNLAAAIGEAGKYAEAQELLRENLEVLGELLGEDHQYLAITRTNIAWLLMAEERFAEARELLDGALVALGRAAGEESAVVAQVRNNLAWLRFLRGDPAGAEEELDQVLALRRRVLGEHHPDVAQTLANLATVRLALGRPAEAEATARLALDVATRGLPVGHWRIAECRTLLAAAALHQGRADEGLEPLRAGLAALEAVKGEGAYEVRWARAQLLRFAAMEPEAATAAGAPR